MQKEDQNENWRRRIERHLFQIKVLLIILIALCFVGFYGLSSVMDMAGSIFKILFWLFMFLVFVYLVALVIERIFMPKGLSEYGTEELKRIIEEAKSDEQKPQS